MSTYLRFDVESHLAEEAKKNRGKENNLQKNALEEDRKCKIPKIWKRSLAYLPKKCADINNTKPKKIVVTNNYPQNLNLLLSLNEQVKISENILKLEKKYGVNIVQQNGQRKLDGPPIEWKGPPPPSGSEIFVGSIPRTVYEDTIYPIFRTIGPIYEMRLMMNFSGTNRGFCFIMYEKSEHAQRAIKELNNYQIQPGWFIGVVQSVNNCRLHITDLPSHTKANTLMQKIWHACQDIDSISVFTNINNPLIKHALLSFKTHRSAAMARRRLLPEQKNFFDKSEVRIDWAHPKISITNVIEESGSLDENGEVYITKKLIGYNTKSCSSKIAIRNAIKNVRKKKLMNSPCKTPNCDITKTVNYKEDNHKGFAINKDLNKTDNEFIQSNSFDQYLQEQIYAYNDDSLEDSSPNILDDFKYSMRSDESLSDFSKSSDTDESKSTFNINERFYNTPPYLISNNCSVIPYPWNTQNYNPLNHVYRQNVQFHTYHPWNMFDQNKFQKRQAYISSNKSDETYNHYSTVNFCSKSSNVQNIRLYSENKKYRPSLNRDLSFV